MNRVIELTFIIIYTGLLTYDFFLSNEVRFLWVKWLLLVSYSVLIVTSLLMRKGERNNRSNNVWEIGFTVYIVALLAFFTIIGGQSASGLSFYNPFLWIVVVISLADTFWRAKREREVM
ncbi:hypothetical protein N780_04355 [Pontibacillus chungwhensis BH030062]|uniref:Uncharacterized protein n=1 Tax=Pontibacillus chungwhensis BH030062 TaxID=1385513 RepID=A0A0A2URU7_9BACI|nr:hypothetical protein [Pontibacillus chungwhensis]KGP90664.1 hypothetical protein N780_04355 [Pontibacillus chungwhensis BH030062]